jgi:hypothetical protein
MDICIWSTALCNYLSKHKAIVSNSPVQCGSSQEMRCYRWALSAYGCRWVPTFSILILFAVTFPSSGSQIDDKMFWYEMGPRIRVNGRSETGWIWIWLLKGQQQPNRSEIRSGLAYLHAVIQVQRVGTGEYAFAVSSQPCQTAFVRLERHPSDSCSSRLKPSPASVNKQLIFRPTARGLELCTETWGYPFSPYQDNWHHWAYLR